MGWSIQIAIFQFGLFALGVALDNGRAVVPPMGWLSWERFRCNIDCSKYPDDCISEHLVTSMANRLVEDGFAALGYNLVGIDDCWLAHTRSSDGRLQADPQRFPSGIRALADYVHSRGLELGIYGDIGSKTCGGFPGMAGNFELDAQTLANWQIDYLKVDGCYADIHDYAKAYPLLGKYLNATGRPITYSCSWPAYLPDPVQTGFQVPYEELKEHCNLWRNWVDIQDSWCSLAAILTFWAKETLHNSQFQRVAGPSAWNDPDMLIIGDQGLRMRSQMEVQMGMWAIFAAPLLMSNDLRHLSSWARDTLSNKLVIGINQDPLGIQGSLIHCEDSCTTLQLWYRKLKNDQRAIAILNLSDKDWDERVCATWSDIDWPPHAVAEAQDVFREGSSTEQADGRYCIEGITKTSINLILAKYDPSRVSKVIQ